MRCVGGAWVHMPGSPGLSQPSGLPKANRRLLTSVRAVSELAAADRFDMAQV